MKQMVYFVGRENEWTAVVVEKSPLDACAVCARIHSNKGELHG
ncbi:MAG: hypothetical protein V1717_01925 [Candidatus Micrarchaeota archaeon]